MKLSRIRWLLLAACVTVAPLAAVKNDSDTVSLIEFYNTDLSVVVRYVADVTGYTILNDSPLVGKVNVSAKNRMTVKESIDLIATMVEGLGYQFERNGSVIRIVAMNDPSRMPQVFTNLADLPQTNRGMVSFLQAIAQGRGDAISATLQRYKSKFGSVQYEAASGKMLLTDTPDMIQKMVSLLRQLDVAPPTGDQHTEVVEIKNLSFEQIQKFVMGAAGTDGAESRYPASERINPTLPGVPDVKNPGLQVIPLDRASMFLFSGPRTLVLEAVERIKLIDAKFTGSSKRVDYDVITLKHFDLDQTQVLIAKFLSSNPPGEGGSRLRGKVEYFFLPPKTVVLIGAEEDRKVLRTMIQELEETVDKNRTPAYGTTVRTVAIQYLKSADLIALLTQFRAAEQNFSLVDPTVTLVDHAVLNSIVILAPERKMATLLELIKNLDRRAFQVLIEVKIIEVTYDKNNRFGVDWDKLNLQNLFPAAIRIPDPLNFALRGISSGLTPATASADAPGYFMSFNDSSVVLNMLGQFGRVNVVSTPNLLTLDNKKAEILISDLLPIPNQQVQLGNINVADKAITTYEYKEAGLKLTLTPRINDVSNVSLTVSLKIDDFKPGLVADHPGISTRSLSSEILIRDSTTAILGGILKTTVSSTAKGLPGVVSVPVVRNIFGKTVDSTTKTELLIFLTPHIVGDDETLKRLSEKKLSDSLFNSMPQITEEERLQIERKKKLEADRVTKARKLAEARLKADEAKAKAKAKSNGAKPGAPKVTP